MDLFYVYNVIIPIACIVVFFITIYSVTDSGPRGKIDITDPSTHVIITGGSSGIGLSTAHMLRKRGCSVTIIARDIEKLNEAKADIDAITVGIKGKLCIASADVSNMDRIGTAITECCVPFNNRVDVLIASAGFSRPGYLEDIGVNMYERMMRVNYLGVLFSTLAVAPMMKKQGFGRLIYISSDAGLANIIGFAGYAPSKCAVRSLSECVQMELKPYNIYTTLVSPPDVNTPMLHEEMQWKPEECKIISETGGLMQPEDISNDIIAAIQSWKFMVNTGFDGWLLGLLSAGITTPCPNVLRAILEIFGGSILRFVGLIYLTYWNCICATHHKKRSKALLDNVA